MLNVELLAHTPDCEKIVASAAKLCYSSSEIKGIMEGLDEEKIKKFLDKLMIMDKLINMCARFWNNHDSMDFKRVILEYIKNRI